MAEGPGRYDDLCTYVRERARADAAVVIVLGGSVGSGFSLQCAECCAADLRRQLPSILEHITAQIRADCELD